MVIVLVWGLVLAGCAPGGAPTATPGGDLTPTTASTVTGSGASPSAASAVTGVAASPREATATTPAARPGGGVATPSVAATAIASGRGQLLIGRGKETVPSAPGIVDGQYCGASSPWYSKTLPTTMAIRVGAGPSELTLSWHDGSSADYTALGVQPVYGIPGGYTIEVSGDSTDGRNGTWREVAAVRDNRVRTRAHRFPFAGASWVRMTVTAQPTGATLPDLALTEIDIYDSSGATSGNVFFAGDSITVMAFNRCEDTRPTYADLVEQGTGRRPATIAGGVGGVNSTLGVERIAEWLTLNPDFAIWAISYGTNDAWQALPPERFEQHLRVVIDAVLATGKRPVLARIPFAAQGPPDANIRALNEVIDRLTAQYKLTPGPDLYGWFKAHPNELQADGVHPTSVGVQSINRLWYEALR